jgi:hypothetical protein
MLMVSTSITLAANITASVDRNPVQPGESFQLTLDVDGNPDNDPDLSPLNIHFDVLSRSQSSGIQVINGKMSKKFQWTLTLMPKREGEIIIPAIHFGNDKSDPVKLTVTKSMTSGQSKSGDTIFLEVSATPKESWVQAQIIYTVRLYRSVSLGNASLSEPSLSDTDAVIKRLGKDSEFDTRIDGKQYRIIERRYAIFPQRSGSLTIKPIVFNGQIALSTSRFMQDPFARNVRNKRVISDSVNINVKAVPAAHKASTWLPANQLKLSEEWQDGTPEFRVGESVTRTLTLIADGLTAAQLPELATVVPKGFKQYPDQPLLNDNTNSTGIIGIRQQKVAIIPTKPGKYTLPEIKIHWWNTKTKREETTRLPAKTIQVLAALDSTSPQTTLPNDLVKSETRIQESVSDELTDNTESQDKLTQDSNTTTQAGYWPWVSLALIIGWLSTVFLLWPSRKNKQNAEPKENDMTQSRKEAEIKLKQACANNDSHATNEALLLWGKSIFPDSPPASLTTLGREIGGDMADQLNTLNKVLYSQSGAEWTGNKLWEEIQHYKKESRKDVDHSKELLAQMYPG